LREETGWEGGEFAESNLGDCEDAGEDAESDKETDDTGTLPGICGSAPLESEE
jgi:hypothetical protein